MSQAAEGAISSRPAWQPLTFGGVAAFARAGLGRLLLAELVTALCVGGSVVCFARHAWSPVILQAIQQMPASAKIKDGQLVGVDDTLVAETKLFAIAVTPEASTDIGQSADVQVQLRRSDFRVGTVFRPDWGWEYEYGRGTTQNLSRAGLEPWWGAWQPVILACVGLATMAVMFVNWAALALIYTVPAKLAAWFVDRELSWTGAWRLSSAALMPGAVLMIAAIFLYGWQAVDLIGLGSLFAAHVVVGWVYFVGAAWACPSRITETTKPNPFKP